MSRRETPREVRERLRRRDVELSDEERERALNHALSRLPRSPREVREATGSQAHQEARIRQVRADQERLRREAAERHAREVQKRYEDWQNRPRP